MFPTLNPRRNPLPSLRPYLHSMLAKRTVLGLGYRNLVFRIAKRIYSSRLAGLLLRLLIVKVGVEVIIKLVRLAIILAASFTTIVG